jgi:hypothetical protein
MFSHLYISLILHNAIKSINIPLFARVSMFLFGNLNFETSQTSNLGKEMFNTCQLALMNLSWLSSVFLTRVSTCVVSCKNFLVDF